MPDETRTFAAANGSADATPGAAASFELMLAMSASSDFATARISTCTGESALGVIDWMAASTYQSVAASMATGKATVIASRTRRKGARGMVRRRSQKIMPLLSAGPVDAVLVMRVLPNA